jgi:[ribosomal protein S5]-alanine N-acetyltransferase
VIETARFTLRPLTEADASDQYRAWLQDAEAQRYIKAAAETRSVQDLRSYIADRIGRHDVLFLGIFDRATGRHIGNIKYEPVDSARGYAIMGVLIGDRGFRGTGVTGEVLPASAAWLKANRGIREIVLGVDRSNTAAIRAYEKSGFVQGPTPHLPGNADIYTMTWTLER